MRNYSKALILAAASLMSVAAGAQERETSDIDAVQIRQQGQEVIAQRFERRNQVSQAQQQQSQQQRPVFQPRAPRDFGNVPSQAGIEVRRDRGGFDRRFEGQPQGNVEVRRDDRRFGNRGRGTFPDNGQQTQVVPVPQTDGRRFNGRRFEQSDGQRFGRNEEYRADRDDSRRFDHNDLRRRGELNQGNNWQRGGDGRWQRRDSRYYGNRDNRDYRDYGYNGGNRDFRWNNDWRRDSRYDWKSYRSANRNFYRQPRYYDPFGSRYGYQRFGIGIVIGSGYYSDRYWISDPYAYRLPYADGPYRWIRYYDDVLLIDIRSGYVVDVIYDFFW